ncbi:protein-methionine-sulfoxide reductase heme-binding subunit MsrQ [Citreicella sp. C3M06]|uniref:protein-methionine-sulfoxide reductase heme-binding subunit MsrQ n=1 Tax=Citreicella sp. C3M06 TaxID=2841564 RepID=UPI001C0811A4|nr:protein-methionine-sulfoxide reductase heme-binding subunit MsrQ [Citreicella sp. C3M06]MBU2959636.1 protein-methionine-sulfoxide reductase heme-binding subunit MsrQ [Citreicella sp. C3M06]
MIADRINAATRRIPAWPLYAISVLPPAWFLYQGLTGGLGVEPISALEHELGQLALKMLIAGLCITPLRRFAGVNLMRYRRAIGLIAFFYVVLHLLVWLVLDVGIVSQIWADILKRPYITVGMGAFALLFPLAVTSNNLSIRKLGAKRWRKLHRLAYAAALLGALHFVMLVKGFQIEPLIYMGIVVVLLALRLPLQRVPFLRASG